MATRLFLTVLFLMGGASAQRAQIIRFFTQADCRPGTPAPGYEELRQSGNVTRANTPIQSYCVVSGAWRVETAWVQSASDITIALGDYCLTCINRGTGTNVKQWGGIHLIVGTDLTRPALSLYPERDFRGKELSINGYEYTFEQTQSFSSFAFTSFNNWTWQTYNLPRWRGNSTCHRSAENAEVTLINPTALNVGSVRLGCRNASPPRFREIGFLLTIIFALAIPCLVVIL